MGKLKKATATIISLIPVNILRTALYNLFPGYKIPLSTRIGLLTIISVDKITIGDNVVIEKYNRMSGPFTMVIGDGTQIFAKNLFECGEWIVSEEFDGQDYARECIIGKNCRIIDCHYIDTVGGFYMEDDCWLAGRGTEAWTHGVSAVDRAVRIGKGSYIGAGVKFSPGASVGKNNIVSLGSVVTSKLDVENHLIAGVPAKPVKDISNDKTKGKYGYG